jgi:hypothetical protein
MMTATESVALSTLTSTSVCQANVQRHQCTGAYISQQEPDETGTGKGESFSMFLIPGRPPSHAAKSFTMDPVDAGLFIGLSEPSSLKISPSPHSQLKLGPLVQ